MDTWWRFVQGRDVIENQEANPQGVHKADGVHGRRLRCNGRLGMTDSAIYHVAGDSIVVTVLMAIFGEMLGIDYRKKIGEYVESEVIGR